MPRICLIGSVLCSPAQKQPNDDDDDDNNDKFNNNFKFKLFCPAIYHVRPCGATERNIEDLVSHREK